VGLQRNGWRLWEGGWSRTTRSPAQSYLTHSRASSGTSGGLMDVLGSPPLQAPVATHRPSLLIILKSPTFFLHTSPTYVCNKSQPCRYLSLRPDRSGAVEQLDPELVSETLSTNSPARHADNLSKDPPMEITCDHAGRESNYDWPARLSSHCTS
jgi:hypothetical protein